MDRFRDIEDLADFIERVCGSTARVLTGSPTTGRMTFVLYESFVFRASLDECTYVFGMALLLPGNSSLITLLGKDLSVNNDPESVKAALAIADGYCRLRLSERYLDAFDRAHPLD